MIASSLDLAGVLHRTVHIANIEEGMEENVAQLMAARAGPVDKWARGVHATGAAGDLSTVTIVFTSMDSVSVALRFNHLPFAGKRLLVWQANKEKPQELLALEYKPPSEEDQAATEERAKRIRDILADLGSGGKRIYEDRRARGDVNLSNIIMSEEERAAFLKEHAYRQAVALLDVTRHHVAAMREELDAIYAELHSMDRGPQPLTVAPTPTLLPPTLPRGLTPGAVVRAQPVLFDR
jgi:hypothetical protein